IRPLPNLEVKFAAANTLIGLNRRETQLLLGTDEIEAIRESISRIRERYFMANTRQQKLKLIDEEKVRRAELTQLLARGTEQGILRETDATVEMADRIASWDPYDQNAAADFFDTEWMFGIKDGFDIAIGNPPYIRHERIRHLRPALQRQFGDFFTNTADISVYFYKRAAELLRSGGFLTYICTNKFMRSGYGRNLRQFLTTDMSLQILLDFGSVSVFDAAVDTCIVLVERCLPAANHAVRAVTLRETSDNFNVREAFQAQAFPISIAQLSSEEWTVAHPNTLALLENLQSTGRSFNETIQGKFYFGIKTGCNDAFIINAATRDYLIAEDADSHEIIKPLLRGRDLRRWEAVFADEYLIAIASSANNEWPWSNAVTVSGAEQVFEETYPAIYQHLSNYRDRLIARADQGMFYWELRSCAYYSVFDGPKLIYPDISSFMRACYDTTGNFAEATTFCIPTTDLSLLAILNSRLFDWYARYKFQTLNDPWAGGGLRLKTIYMQRVPIADRTPEQKAELSRLVEQILEDPENDGVPALEKEIDALVYRLYGLTTNEIALIEQTYRDAGMEV
ncbi:MAG: Eco57I restriction-modification methylase domain-containing protein, partial [Candidatus Poribacteria bacterium]|nr:Eco57I restriction-modification methylase domain-containing protein [Candidatus Poribacteria bacterium]